MWVDKLSIKTTIIGDGCAALTLAAMSDKLPNHLIQLVKPDNAPVPIDHMWGFWGAKGLERQISLSRKKWNNWAIITESGQSIMSSEEHPYYAIHRNDWLNYCRSEAKRLSVDIIDNSDFPKDSDLVFDSRPPRTIGKAMLQHFYGIEVETKTPTFDSETAVLMDFRVDQSKGLHFIYLLPFSTTNALIESTIFSTDANVGEFYNQSINEYLDRIYSCTQFTIKHEEQGIIPMGSLKPHDPNIPGIGGNAGAIRPGSGYAFVFIQKQIDAAIERSRNTGDLYFKTPHRKIDLWMDGVLLTVLENYPEKGPKLFLQMAKSLSGDQFAKFMSGEISWSLRLKVIFAMPKLLFIKGVTRHIFRKRNKGVL